MASVQAGATEAGFLALAPAPPSSPIPPHHEQLVLSILLTLAGAAALSLSLVTQRFALSYPEAYIPCCGVRLPQNLVWFGGLVLYGAANGLKVVALQWGPLSVLSCIFTTVLVFNIVLARLLLREQLTAPKVMGALIIVVGAGLASVGACQTCQTEFSASEVEHLLTSGPPGGYAYVGVLIVSILVSACLICWYDARHPPTKRPPDGTTTASMSLTADITEGASVQLVVPSDPTTGAPSRWLEGVMAVVYAGCARSASTRASREAPLELPLKLRGDANARAPLACSKVCPARISPPPPSPPPTRSSRPRRSVGRSIDQGVERHLGHVPKGWRLPRMDPLRRNWRLGALGVRIGALVVPQSAGAVRDDRRSADRVWGSQRGQCADRATLLWGEGGAGGMAACLHGRGRGDHTGGDCCGHARLARRQRCFDAERQPTVPGAE